MAAFYAARSQLVVSPNRGSRDYGIYVSLTLAALLIAIVLENESLPAGSATLHYVLVPQLVALMGLHLSIWYSQEPWLVTLGGGRDDGDESPSAPCSASRASCSGRLTGSRCWCSAALLAFLWLEGRLDAARVRQRELDLHRSRRRRPERRRRRKSRGSA